MRLISSAEIQAPEPLLPLLEAVGDACIAAEGLQGRCQAGLLLTNDAGIQKINREQRGKDAPTDVLSFPSATYPAGTARRYPKRLRRELDPETGCLHLGDIVISLPRAQAQAEQYGHAFLREAGFLFAHGMLHLMGYDHETETDRAMMRDMEEKIMEKAGLDRSLTDQDFELIEGARKAREMAYAPYSRYSVGACVRAEDGRTFQGCNVENASFGLTICAERNAATTAVTAGVRKITAIAVAAEGTDTSPCGACRQFLREFGRDMRVLLVSGEKVRVTTLAQLLPDSFGPESMDEVKA